MAVRDQPETINLLIVITSTYSNTQHYAVYISCMPSRRFAARQALGYTTK